MQRVFTRQVGSHQAGEIKDWPSQTWRKLEENTGETRDAWSAPVEEVAAKGATRKKPGRPPKQPRQED